MPGQPAVGPEISVTELKGLQLNKPRSLIDQGYCDRNFGLYPRYPGSLNRLPGKQLLRVFEDGDIPREVLQVAQAFMGQSYIIAQNGDAIGLYTADELFNRVTPYDITPTPPVDTLGSYVLLAHQEANAAEGGLLGSTNNTFYPGTTNTLLSDADGVVQAVSGNSFTLGLGTYTINAAVTWGQLSSSLTAATSCRAGLFSVTNNAFKTYLGTVHEILGTTGRGASWQPASGNSTANNTIFIKGVFEVTLPEEVFSIYMAGASAIAWPAQSYAQGYPATGLTGKPELFKLIQISKIA